MYYIPLKCSGCGGQLGRYSTLPGTCLVLWSMVRYSTVQGGQLHVWDVPTLPTGEDPFFKVLVAR